MSGFDPATAALVLPWWAAVALVLLIALLAVLAIVRGGGRRVMTGFVQIFALVLFAFVVWNYFDRMTMQEKAAEWRGFEQRLSEIEMRATAAGSAIACLDGLSGDVVADACERAIFAKPETLAAATAYVALKLSLLREASGLEARGHLQAARPLAELRRFAERDRFGLVAQVLVARFGCTPDVCTVLSVLEQPERIMANMRERTFDVHVGRHVGAWLSQPASPASAPLASAAQAAAAPSGATEVNIDFPTASSIPPVSIMNNEPGMTGQNGMAPAADAPAGEAKPNPPPRRTASPAPAAPVLPQPRPAARAAAPATPAAARPSSNAPAQQAQ